MADTQYFDLTEFKKHISITDDSDDISLNDIMFDAFGEADSTLKSIVGTIPITAPSTNEKNFALEIATLRWYQRLNLTSMYEKCKSRIDYLLEQIKNDNMSTPSSRQSSGAYARDFRSIDLFERSYPA